MSENDLRQMIEELKARVAELEEGFYELRSCAECGFVFVDRNAYAHHKCAGRQEQ